MIPKEIVEQRIFMIRDRKVMLDFHLADLYGVQTKVLNQAVSRNSGRFPEDFVFRLSKAELNDLDRSQLVTGSQRHRDPKFPPRAFTQEGVAMLSSVLRSKRAVQANIAIMRTFVRMREAMISHQDLSRRLNQMEAKYDAQFRSVFDALRALMQPEIPKKRPIGYIHPKDE